MTKPKSGRNAEIASAIAAGRTATEVASAYGITPARVRQIASAEGAPSSTAGRPRTDAVTPRTARGAAILSRVVKISEAAGIEPEAVVDVAERELRR